MSQSNLFPDDKLQVTPGSAPDQHLVARLRRSAAWAAFGDALGFISELTDERGLHRRTGGRTLDKTMAWNRRIGGRSGIEAQLPAGCYSDDTQLRLATGRSISDGQFDVETFARIELPVFPSYALGGGRGTKAAAANLARPSTPWFANSYRDWLNGGGNGAAMRIQPHVWAAHAQNSHDTMMRDVLRNTVCTHAHPIAMFGSFLHASSVDFVLSNGSIPDSDDVAQLVEDARHVVDLIEDDRDGLRNWRSAWQAESDRSFTSAWNDVVDEIGRCVGAAQRVQPGSASFYPELLRALGLFNPERRGSGAHTALAAVMLANWSSLPSRGVEEASRAVGSDTDTIATMAGAILGCVADTDPPSEVLDATYIDAEVERISDVSSRTPPRRHDYPDMLTWSAPRTQADALCLDGDKLHVAGLGEVAHELGDPIMSADRKFAWQWIHLEIGQTLLIKRRPELEQLSEGNRISTPRSLTADKPKVASLSGMESPAGAFDSAPTVDLHEVPRAARRSIELTDVLSWLEKEGFDDMSIGFAIRRMAVRGTPAQMASLLAVVLDRLAGSQPPADR